MPLITDEQVVLDLTGADRHEATRALAERLVASGRCTDLDTFLADVTERESKMATGLPGGIGIPHARSAAITEPALVFGRSADGIDWGAKDGPATLVFLIAAPEGGGDAHMQMLPKLARALMKKDFKAALAAATTEAEVVAIVEEQVSLDPPKAAPAAAAATATATATATTLDAGAAQSDLTGGHTSVAVDDGPRSLTLVGVTSCPTGIAHTYMAAESLENAAKAAGHEIKVETQGSAGTTPLALPSHRRRRRGDLRRRPPGQGRRPLRRQADRRRGRQEGHLRRPGPHRGGRARSPPSGGPTRSWPPRRWPPAPRCRAACPPRSTATPAPSPSCASG